MPLHICTDLSEAANFESSLGLFLKPISKIKINVQLPKLNVPGQSISSWHVMEKLKETIRPDTFLYLKSLKITTTVIKFEGELETKSSCERALARLRAAGSLKLNGFSERLQIRAAHATSTGPTRHDWESFYRDAKGVNEMKPGERPDTIHLEEIPVSWFTEHGKFLNPNEKLLRKAFGTFGKIRRIEIPPKTTSESSMFGKTSSLHNDLLFEAYIQYEEYVEFVIAMESLRGKKLLYKEPDGKVYSADIKVDFDRTNYLSERCINQRAALCKEAQKTVSSPEDKKVAVKDKQLEISQKPKPRTSDKHLSTNLEEKIHHPFTVNNEKAQKEAQFLLKELLRRAEITERCKEKQLKVSSTSFQTEDKKSKLSSTKGSKTTKVLKENEKQLKSHNSKSVKEKHMHLSKDKSKLNKSSEHSSSSEERVSHRDKNIQKDRRHKHKYKHTHTQSKDRKKDKKTDKMKEREKQHQTKLEEKKIKERLSNMHEQEKKDKEKLLLEQERKLKEKLIRNLKARQKEKLKVREKLRKELAGSKVLKSVLANPNISLSKRNV